MPICPLCEKQVSTLHKRSHIIPEWMYRECYDEKHKMIKVELERECVIKGQKGDYEEIICTDCERQSQIYDHYASLVLSTQAQESPEHKAVGRKSLEKPAANGRMYLDSYWSNLNFHRFQRFVLGVVLRSHLARKKQGSDLLTEKHFNNIRAIYMNSDSINDTAYPVMVYRYIDGSNVGSIVFLPFLSKNDGHSVIKFSGAGYLFSVFASSHNKAKYVYTRSLHRDGTLRVLHVPVGESGALKSAIPEVVKLAHRYSNI